MMIKKLLCCMFVYSFVAPTPRERAIEDTKCFPDRHIAIGEIKCRMPELVLLQPDIDLGYMLYKDFTILAYEYIDTLYEPDINGQKDPKKLKLIDKYSDWLARHQRNIIKEISKTDFNIHYRSAPEWHQQIMRNDVQKACEEMSQQQRERDEREAKHQADMARIAAMRPAPRLPDLSMLVNCVGAARDIFQQAQGVHQQLQDAGLISNTATESSAGPAQTAPQPRSHAAPQSASRPAQPMPRSSAQSASRSSP